MKRIITGILLYFACSWSAASQSTEPVGISTGTRVRVSVDNGALVTGSVVRLTSQTIELADSRAAVHLMNTPNVTSLEVSRGRPVYGHRLAKGALKGFLILGGAATVVLLASDPGYAFVGPLVFGPPGAVIGGIRANATRPEVWERLPVSALAAPRDGGTHAFALPSNVSTTQRVAPKPGRGRQIAIGAAIGVAAGAAIASSNTSASPMGTKMVMFAIPAGLLGGAIGAFIH